MASTLGPNDLKQWALPAGWDAARLMQLQLASGETYDQLISDIAGALSIQNAALLTDPLIASLVHVTEESAIEYPVGVSNGFEDHTEYGLPDAKRGKTTGHMFAPYMKDRGFGWTWDFLRKARRAQIDADIASGMTDLRDIWQKSILTRLFKETYTAVGSAGKSMPLADGGTADTTYVPPLDPTRSSSAFLYTHDHIKPVNGITQALLETEVANLWEHGVDGPFDLLISLADVSSWANTTNVTGWIKRADGLIRYGTTVDLAEAGGDYVAVIETSAYGTVRVRASGRVPTTFWALYKSYGPLDSRNVIAIKPSSTYGIGAVLLAGDHVRQFPLEKAFLFTEWDMGSSNRVGAVVAKNTSGSYADPTIG
jgi:hypothetical protein